MAVLFGFGCNICYKTDDGSLNDISKENMKHVKDTLITFVGHADIINYNEIYLCQLCCAELIHFDKFRELCFSHLIQLRQNCFNMLPQLDLEGSEANSNNTLKTFVHQVLRRNSVDTNNCPVSITTEYNEVKSFDDLNESDLDFNGQVINLRSQRNECEFVGDCSTGSVINSVIKCDESRVAYMNEEDIKHVMIRRSEDIKLEKCDVSNVSDTLQIQFMKEEIDLNSEIESSDPEIFTLTSFENKSGEQVNLDVKEPVVNDSSNSMKEELHMKQENSHSEGVKLERIDEFGDGVHVAFEITNVCTIVNVGNGENEDIVNQEGEIGMKLRSRRHNNKLTAATIDAQSNRPHVREYRNKRSSTTRQSDAHSGVYPSMETHTCDVCNKSFRTSSCLTRHARTHNDGTPHKCTVCKKTFTNTSALTVHERMHSRARPYKCSVCHKAFTASQYLAIHERIHSGDRPYRCTVCSKTFTQSAHLLTHERIHSGVRPYKCAVCNKTFAQLGNLTTHERIHSGVRAYKCTVCNKMFSQSSNLARHESIHSGARPYKCTVCNKTFKHPHHLMYHKRTHSDERAYKCTVCNKTFKYSFALTKHKRLHSDDRNRLVINLV